MSFAASPGSVCDTTVRLTGVRAATLAEVAASDRARTLTGTAINVTVGASLD
jgi:hypothetical protein